MAVVCNLRKLCLPIAVFVAVTAAFAPAAPLYRRQPLRLLSAMMDTNDVAVDDAGPDHSELKSWNAQILQRRNLLQGVLLTGLCLSAPLAALAAAADKKSSHSADQQQQPPVGLVSRDRVGDLLRVVPTYTIVDKAGVPFMVVGEDAKVTGYFFTAYDEATRILKLASESADRSIQAAQKENKQQPDNADDGQLSNPWKQARVSTVPLDTAVTLSLKAGSGQIRNYFQVSASASDIDDALAVTGKSDLAEGKVPLFYYKDFDIGDSSPLYFSKSQLEAAYRKANPKQSLPETKVTELFGVLSALVKPGGTDTDLKRLVFVAPVDSDRRVEQCKRAGGKAPPFLLGQRNIVL